MRRKIPVRQPEARDLLVEIGTEELPPRALRDLESAFVDGVVARLKDAGLTHGAVRSFATPRRLAVLVKDLAARQPDQDIVKRGPPASAARDPGGGWTRAAMAFAQANGVSPEKLERRTESKGEFLYFVGRRLGAATPALVPSIVSEALAALPVPKMMRWGASDALFVRPVHWVLMLWGGAILGARLFDLPAGRETRGHRFHAPRPLRIANPAAYEQALATRGWVIADFSARRARVRDQVTTLAAKLGGGAGGRAVFDDALLDEVTALVEWPVAIEGRFEDRFLALPREVLISTLQAHQRYFPVEDAAGRLMPWFIAVSNIKSRQPARVRAGNERVVRPRLTDAAFFWEQDRRLSLNSRRAALAAVTFQAKLGSLADKSARVRALAAELATALGGPPDLATRAAELCKCDLLTAMVGEFPDLQGIMGSYYARADGEPPEVCEALREVYLPRGAGDSLPATKSGAALSLADRLDTLAGIFAIGQKPSGTKDPFGLRRAAIGVLRILIEGGHDLDVVALLERAVALQPVQGVRVAAEIYDYLLERLRAYVDENAVRLVGGPATTEMFDAVLAARPRSPLDFVARLRALKGFLAGPAAASLIAANKRTANILVKSAGTAHRAGTVAPEALREPAEKHLHAALQLHRDSVRRAIERQDYAGALADLSKLRPEVDAFFDNVMVMDADPTLRANRLGLLGELRSLFTGVADLSRLPG
jgi:glycyl-tRNA synthetase beta chain